MAFLLFQEVAPTQGSKVINRRLEGLNQADSINIFIYVPSIG